MGLQINIFNPPEVQNNLLTTEIQKPLSLFTILLCKLFGFFICHIPLLGKIQEGYYTGVRRYEFYFRKNNILRMSAASE